MTDGVTRGAPTPLFSKLLPALAILALLPAFTAAKTGALPVTKSCKPLPPVEVRLVPLDDGRPGNSARFTLEVVPRRLSREVRVRWSTSSDRLTWISGDSVSVRPARLDEAEAFQVSVRVPRSGQEILHCQIEVVDESGGVWRRGVGVALGPEAGGPRGRPARDRDGGALIEYDAAPADRIAGSGR